MLFLFLFVICQIEDLLQENENEWHKVEMRTLVKSNPTQRTKLLQKTRGLVSQCYCMWQPGLMLSTVQ